MWWERLIYRAVTEGEFSKPPMWWESKQKAADAFLMFSKPPMWWERLAVISH